LKQRLAEEAARQTLETTRLADEVVRQTLETTRLTGETKRLEVQIAALPRPTPPPAIDPRAELEAFTRANAIFFSVETAFRDEVATRDVLDQLARLMKRDPSLVRIVGYTDDVGSPAKNAALQKARADTVATALVARGVAPGRLVAIKRTTLDNVAVSLGSRSANRRVEFEVGFIGESAE
jgi:outer membrane protein OmpA-like peptidoglycan-associated protein